LIGECAIEHLDEVRAQVSDAPGPVVVDIGELTLVSGGGYSFSQHLPRQGDAIINASGYITEWMTLERASQVNRE